MSIRLMSFIDIGTGRIALEEHMSRLRADAEPDRVSPRVGATAAESGDQACAAVERYRGRVDVDRKRGRSTHQRGSVFHAYDTAQ